MFIQGKRFQENKSRSVANEVTQRKSVGVQEDRFVDNRLKTIQEQRIIQLASGKNAFLAGTGAYWHVHYDHVKFGSNAKTRVNFKGRTAKEVRKKLNEVKGETPKSAAGSLSYHQCINYIDKHLPKKN